ncbi:MAG: RidA family protein [Bacteroidia bacterium]
MNKKIINSVLAPAPIGPYSQAVQAGNFLFISGQIAIDRNSGNLINDDIEAETTQVLNNIKFILKQAGYNFENVIKSTIFLKDMENFGAVNQVYGSYFSDDFPARETVEVSRLPKDVNVEISVIAYK